MKFKNYHGNRSKIRTKKLQKKCYKEKKKDISFVLKHTKRRNQISEKEKQQKLQYVNPIS